MHCLRSGIVSRQGKRAVPARAIQACLALWLAASPAVTAQCISVNAAADVYTQNFDGIATAPPPGWRILESGTSARNDGNPTAGNGADTSGDAYSFGANGSAERSLGTLRSGSLIPVIGACFVNRTGQRLTSLSIAYTGEMWRAGAANRGAADRLDFQLGLDASGLAQEEFGEPLEVDELDFRSPVIRTAAGAVDGNSVEFRSRVEHSITGITIEDGATFWIRWTDFDITGSDDGLAIDDFSLRVSTLPTATIGDFTALEGNSGVKAFRFPIRLSHPAGAGGAIVSWRTRDGSAMAPDDFEPSAAGVTRIAAGQSSGEAVVLITGDTSPEPDETFFVDLIDVPGAVIGKASGVGTILDDDAVTTCAITHTIAQIQGSGRVSAIVGSLIASLGVVTSRKSNGFFIQMPVGDGDPATSDAIFVFTGTNVPARAQVGNELCISGTVTEFVPSADPFQEPLTQLTNSTIGAVLAAGSALPAPVELTSADGDRERFEGMRVSVPSLRVVGPTMGSINETSATATSNGTFYAVVEGVARPFREPGISSADPLPEGAPAAIPRFDGNPERLRVVAPGVDVAAGQIVGPLTGVLDYAFRTDTILADPGSFAITGPMLPTVAPAREPHEVSIASLNLERLFDDRNDPSIGEPVVNRAAYLKRLYKTALLVRDVLALPDVIGVQEAENLTVLQELAATITQQAPGTDYIALLEEGNDPGGIDSGFLVNAARVKLLEVTQHGKSETFNDRPPLLLRASAAGSVPFTVIVNHLRSLNDIADPVDGARVRAKRRDQAEYLARLIQQRMDDDPAEPLLALGDFNAFEFSDGYVDVLGTVAGRPAPADQVVLASPDLVDPDLTGLALTLPPAERYSYVFDGSAQVLDHVLANPAAAGRVSRFLYTHANADFPETARNDGTTPLRVTDHDQPVVYLALPPATATPGSIRARSSAPAPGR